MISFTLKPGVLKQIYFVLIAYLTYLLGGVSRSYVAFLIYQLELPDSTILANKDQQSWIASCNTILSPLGCIVSGVLMDYFGRKIYVQSVFLPFIFSWIIISYATSVEMLYVGMIIQSLGTSMAFCIPSYVSEISTSNLRGALFSIIEPTFSISILICSILMTYIKWNTVALIFALLSVFGFTITFVLPESPIWLYSKGHPDKSIKTLQLIRCVENFEQIEREVREMEEACASKTKLNFISTVRNCVKAWKQFLIATSLFMLLQTSGYAVMVSLIITVIDSLRIPYDSSSVAIFYSVSGVIASVITPYTIHTYRRKCILKVSALGMMMCMITVLVYEHIFYNEDSKPFVWIVPVSLFVYIFMCTIGVLPLSFVIGGELFPHEVKGTLMGLNGAFGYGYLTIILKVFPKFLSNFGIKAVLLTFVVTAFIIVLHATFVLPETKGKSLNEVQELYFRKKKKVNREMCAI